MTEFNTGNAEAYFITFSCYGRWLHGDVRGSSDRKHNEWLGPPVPENPRIENTRRSSLSQPPMSLSAKLRNIVGMTIHQVADHNHWSIQAMNVLPDHVHVVVTASKPPEAVMNTFKAWATRRLREKDLIGRDRKVWSRHGSTRYLWDTRSVDQACEYVKDCQ